MASSQFGDISVTIENYVAVVEIRRPPHNYFDFALIRSLKEAFDALDADANCRLSSSHRKENHFARVPTFKRQLRNLLANPSCREVIFRGHQSVRQPKADRRRGTGYRCWGWASLSPSRGLPCCVTGNTICR